VLSKASLDYWHRFEIPVLAWIIVASCCVSCANCCLMMVRSPIQGILSHGTFRWKHFKTEEIKTVIGTRDSAVGSDWLRNGQMRSQISSPSRSRSQVNPVRTTPSYFSKINLNISLPLLLDFPSGLFPSGFPTKILHSFLFSHVSYITFSSHSP
jgi:hypothetical protein